MSIIKKIGFTIEIDEKAIAPQSVNVFIYRLLNDINNETPISSITVDDVTILIKDSKDLYELPLGEDKPLVANEKVK